METLQTILIITTSALAGSLLTVAGIAIAQSLASARRRRLGAAARWIFKP